MSIDVSSCQSKLTCNPSLEDYVRVANNHFGDLNSRIACATTPNELVNELRVAGAEALKIATTEGHTDEYQMIYRDKAVRCMSYLTQVRHVFDLGIGERVTHA